MNDVSGMDSEVVAMELGAKTDDWALRLIFLIVQVESVLLSHSAIDYVVIDKGLLSSMLLKTSLA